MMFFEKLDLAILDGIYQPIADWVANTFGKSCFWLAKVMTWIFLIMASIAAAHVFTYGSALIGSGLTSKIYVFVLLCILGSIQLMRIRILEKQDGSWEENIATRVMNTQRMFNPYGLTRLILIALVIISAILGALYIPPNYPAQSLIWSVVNNLLFSTSFISTYYFAACTPKPPSPLKAGNRLAVKPMST